MRAGICKWYIQSGFNIQNIQRTHTTNIKKTQKNLIKNGQKTWIDILLKKVASRYMKRCSTLQIIKEMQIKNTMIYHFTPVIMIVIKKTKNKCLKNMGKWENSYSLLWECKLVYHYRKHRLFKKLKIELPYSPAFLLLIVIQRKWKHSLWSI